MKKLKVNQKLVAKYLNLWKWNQAMIAYERMITNGKK